MFNPTPAAETPTNLEPPPMFLTKLKNWQDIEVKMKQLWQLPDPMKTFGWLLVWR